MKTLRRIACVVICTAAWILSRYDDESDEQNFEDWKRHNDTDS